MGQNFDDFDIYTSVLNLYATRLESNVGGFMIKEELANKRLEKRINTSKLK